ADDATGRILETVDAAQQGRLAGTGAADNGDDVAVARRQRHALQHIQLAELLVQVLDMDRFGRGAAAVPAGDTHFSFPLAWTASPALRFAIVITLSYSHPRDQHGPAAVATSTGCYSACRRMEQVLSGGTSAVQGGRQDEHPGRQGLWRAVDGSAA